MIWWLPNGLIFRWHGFHLQHNCGKLLPNSKFLIWSLFSKYAGNPYKKKIGIFGSFIRANSSNIQTTYKKLPMTLLVLLFWQLFHATKSLLWQRGFDDTSTLRRSKNTPIFVISYLKMSLFVTKMHQKVSKAYSCFPRVWWGSIRCSKRQGTRFLTLI